MYVVQGAELHNLEEPEEAAGQAAVEQVLRALPKTHSSSGRKGLGQ
jgi:hypothetical protein